MDQNSLQEGESTSYGVREPQEEKTRTLTSFHSVQLNDKRISVSVCVCAVCVCTVVIHNFADINNFFFQGMVSNKLR